MLFLLSVTIIIILCLLLYSYNLFIIYIIRRLKKTHLKITFFSSCAVILSLLLTIHLLLKMISEKKNTINIIKLFQVVKEKNNAFALLIYQNGIINREYIILLVIIVAVTVIVTIFITIILISQYIRISFKRMYYLLLNNEKYRYYRCLLDLIYITIYNSEKNKIYSIFDKNRLISEFTRLFFFFLNWSPIVTLLLSIIYDCIYNEYILEKYFYVCCVFPIYYLIINIVSFLTENSLQRADDMVVYAAIYGKDSEYIQQDFLEELEKYKYETSISDVFGAQDLKTRHQHTFTNEEYRAIQKYKEIEKTLLNFF